MSFPGNSKRYQMFLKKNSFENGTNCFNLINADSRNFGEWRVEQTTGINEIDSDIYKLSLQNILTNRFLP